MSVQFLGSRELRKALQRLSPAKNRRILASALTESAQLTARIAAEEAIIRGGRVRGARGPRGGRGKLSDAPPHPTRLTSRSGRLRGSLAGSGYRRGIDASGLPRFIEVGSDVAYAAVHEFGGSVTQHVPAHTRSSAFGRATKPFRVNAYTKTNRYPRRSFLAPALDDASRRFPSVIVRAWSREAGL